MFAGIIIIYTALRAFTAHIKVNIYTFQIRPLDI
jgi:hypothetical protein